MTSKGGTKEPAEDMGVAWGPGVRAIGVKLGNVR